MELEDLRKHINAKARESYAVASAISSSAVFDAGSRSVSLLDKMLNSIRWELAFAAAFALGCLLVAISANSLPVVVFLVLLSAYSFAFSLYLYRLHHRTTSHVLSTGSIRASVSGTIELIENFTRLYLRLSTSFVPAIFVAAFIAGLLDFIEKGYHLTEIPYFSLILYSIIAIIWILLMRKFTNWWLNRIYGRYLLELKRRLKEIDNNE
ncbi:MAG: hypothetical protein ABI151_04925 [Chitinophagaceae bacterium]